MFTHLTKELQLAHGTINQLQQDKNKVENELSECKREIGRISKMHELKKTKNDS